MSESDAITPCETRLQWLLRTGRAAPRFLQGVFPFVGRGLFDPLLLDETLRFVVPPGRATTVVYLRAGNHSDDLIYLMLVADGAPRRYFPVGPKADANVALAIYEGHPAGTELSLHYAAPRGIPGTVVIDLGLVDMPA
jgi:assimilatory nitrate reductase catalytic subunit